MDRKFPTLLVLVLLLAACSAATQAVQPSIELKQATLLASALQSSPLSSILINNGFEIDPACETLCFSHESGSPRMAANIQENGGLVIHVFKDAGGRLDMQVIQLIITQAYGQDLADWITAHLEAALNEDQTGSVGSHQVWMRVYADKGIIRITPGR